jgi:hypothetical protein
MDKIHQDGARMFEFLRIQRHHYINDLTRDPLDPIEFFPHVTPNRIGDLEMFSNDGDIIAGIRRNFWFCHKRIFLKGLEYI